MVKDNKIQSLLIDEYTFKMWYIDVIEYFLFFLIFIGENKVLIYMIIYEGE